MYNITKTIILNIFILLTIFSTTSVQAAEVGLTREQKIERILEAGKHLSEEFIYGLKILDHDIKDFDEDGSIIFHKETIYSGISKHYAIGKIFGALKATEDMPIEFISSFLQNIKTKLRRAMHIACGKPWPEKPKDQAKIDGILTGVLCHKQDSINLIIGPIEQILDLFRELFGNNYLSDSLLKNSNLRIHDIWMFNHILKFIPMVMFTAITNSTIAQENLILSNYAQINPNIMYFIQIVIFTVILNRKYLLSRETLTDSQSEQIATTRIRSESSLTNNKVLAKLFSIALSSRGLLIFTMLYHIFYINYGDHFPIIDFLAIFMLSSISTILQYAFIKLKVMDIDSGIEDHAANFLCDPLRKFNDLWNQEVESKIRCTDEIIFHLVKLLIPITTIIGRSTIDGITKFCSNMTTVPRDPYSYYEELKENIRTFMQNDNFDLEIETDERKIKTILEIANSFCKEILEKNKLFIDNFFEKLKALNIRTDTDKVEPEIRMELLKFKPNFLYQTPADIPNREEYSDFINFLKSNFNKSTATEIRTTISTL